MTTKGKKSYTNFNLKLVTILFGRESAGVYSKNSQNN